MYCPFNFLEECFHLGRKFLLYSASNPVMDSETRIDYRRRQAELVLRAQSGDRTAFDCLAAPMRGGLLGIAFLRTGDRLEADDLVQDTLGRAWEHLNDLRDPSAFAAWIRSILARGCNTWHRRCHAQPASLSDSRLCEYPADACLQPLTVLLQRERDEELRAALRDISPENRDALLMAIWGDCTYVEIAEFTGVPVTTVEGRIHRAKSQLRKKLRDAGAEALAEPRRLWRADEGDDK